MNEKTEKTFSVDVSKSVTQFFESDALYTMLGNELTKVKLIGTDISEDGVKPIALVNGEEWMLNPDTRFYKTPEDFEKGNVVKFSTTKPLWYIPSRNEMKFVCNDDGVHAIQFWHMVDGVPTKEDIIIKSVRITYNTITINGQEWFDDIYQTEERCIKWNDYYVVDEQGKRLHKSNLRKALPTPEQIKLINEMIEAAKRCADAGIVMTIDCDDNLVAYNKNHIAKYMWDEGDEGAIDHYVKGVNVFKSPCIYVGECTLVPLEYKD